MRHRTWISGASNAASKGSPKDVRARAGCDDCDWSTGYIPIALAQSEALTHAGASLELTVERRPNHVRTGVRTRWPNPDPNQLHL